MIADADHGVLVTALHLNDDLAFHRPARIMNLRTVSLLASETNYGTAVKTPDNRWIVGSLAPFYSSAMLRNGPQDFGEFQAVSSGFL